MKGHKTNFWCDKNILYLDLASGYTDKYIEKFHELYSQDLFILYKLYFI